MISRYWSTEMRRLWDGSVTKFSLWLKVELAVIAAREELGQIPSGTHARIAQSVWMDEQVARTIERRDALIEHDLNAFIEIMRMEILLKSASSDVFDLPDKLFHEYIDRALSEVENNPDAGYFHDGMTSYDTEEPAMSLLVGDSIEIIFDQLDTLQSTLIELARQYRGVPMMGRTHGQHAQPITFGVKILNWLDMIDRSRVALRTVAEEARVMKLSGAVGMYGTLLPQVELFVADRLHLKPVIATQIIPLDRRVRVVCELAVLSGIVEKIAHDLWLMAQTEVGEIREPFSKRQKGSSAMPHKKNPIGLENIRGCAALMRGYAATAMELIATSHERDISHSAPERLLLPDAFGILNHQLKKLIAVLKGMEVFPERMLQNLEMGYGTFASQQAEMALKRHGMSAEGAYRTVQEMCAEAIAKKRSLRDLIIENFGAQLPKLSDDEAFRNAFDYTSWIEHETFLYERARKVNRS